MFRTHDMIRATVHGIDRDDCRARARALLTRVLGFDPDSPPDRTRVDYWLDMRAMVVAADRDSPFSWEADVECAVGPEPAF